MSVNVEREKIGRILMEARVKKNMCQREVAESVGITAAYVGQIEKGKKNVSYDVLTKMCKLLELNFF